MEKLVTVARVVIAGMMVWRLTRLLLLNPDGLSPGDTDNDYSRHVSLVHMRPEDFFGRPFMDMLYWLNAWVSARSAIWAAYGFTCILLAWVVFVGISRLWERAANRTRHALGEAKPSEEEDLSAFAANEGIQTNHA